MRPSRTDIVQCSPHMSHITMLPTCDMTRYFMVLFIVTQGPAKTPEGLASGSFGPTTAGRMDGYVASFMENGGSFITLAKGNRQAQCVLKRKYRDLFLLFFPLFLLEGHLFLHILNVPISFCFCSSQLVGEDVCSMITLYFSTMLYNFGCKFATDQTGSNRRLYFHKNSSLRALRVLAGTLH